jgi:hypothetical protein
MGMETEEVVVCYSLSFEISHISNARSYASKQRKARLFLSVITFAENLEYIPILSFPLPLTPTPAIARLVSQCSIITTILLWIRWSNGACKFAFELLNLDVAAVPVQ